METRRSSPLRLIAPIALVVFAVALVLVISSSGGSGGDEGKSNANAAEKAKDLGTPASERRSKHRSKRDRLPQDVYIVKSGDTLGGIAEKTGVPVERLQELNPGLDQFSLVEGQRIKLR
jgi:LysM repeat protein